MISKKTIDLGASDDEETNSKSLLTVNKKYADRYDNWRNKEELQKRKFYSLIFKRNNQVLVSFIKLKTNTAMLIWTKSQVRTKVKTKTQKYFLYSFFFFYQINQIYCRN